MLTLTLLQTDNANQARQDVQDAMEKERVVDEEMADGI